MKQLAISAIAVFLLLAPVGPALAVDLPFATESNANVPAVANVPAPADSNPTETASNQIPSNVDGPDVPALENPSDLAPGKEKKRDEITPEPETQSSLMSGEFTDPNSGNVTFPSKQRLPETDANSGALVYQHPIVVPPGRNGLAPDLKLQYNSQNTEDVNLLGYGWSVNIPYIERVNKTGTNNLYSSGYFTSSLSGELVNVSGSSYRAKVDNGEFLDYTIASNVWTVKDKNGTIFKFGTNATERQDNPADSTKVYKWMLQEVRDMNDNYIKYEYYKNSGQIYPDKIKYTGNGSTDGIFEIEFLRELRNDVSKSYVTAFLVTTSYRISEIKTKVNDVWVRKYSLAYTFGDNGTRSLLASIVESGQDENLIVKTMPATSFAYNTGVAGWDLDTTSWTAPTTFGDSFQSFFDMNGDSLPDIVESYTGTQEQKHVYLNNSNGTWSNNANLQPPILFRQTEVRGGAYSQAWDQGVRVGDVNGDMLPDIIKAEDNENGKGGFDAYVNTNGTSWTQNSVWHPTLTFNGDDNIYNWGAHFLDMNSDGLTDIMRKQGNLAGTQLNAGTLFGSVTASWDPTHDLSSARTQFADVNNDSLPDIIYMQWNNANGQTDKTVYLNSGNGTWVVDNAYEIPIDIVTPTNGDAGVRFFDVNGDGLVDVVPDYTYMISGRNTYLNTGVGWVQASNWNVPEDTAIDFVDDPINIVDINTDGSLDFFITQNSVPLVTKAWKNKTVTSVDTLKKITYSEGGYTDIAYKTSAKYKNGATLLNPNLPINLLTAEVITNNNGFANVSTYTYTYEGGKYYFGSSTDRKFAGFGKVTRADSAGNKQVTYYHQGDTTNSSLGEYDDHPSKIGKVYRTETLSSGGSKYHVVINKWDKYNQGTGRDFVKLVQTIDFAYDGNSTHKDKAVTYTYDDATGNLTQSVDWGEVSGAESGTFSDLLSDKLTTDTAFAVNTGSYIHLPKTITVTDSGANKVRESKLYYDGAAHGTVTKGNLTKEEKWKSGSTYVNTQKTYNSTYGTVATETDERGKVTLYTMDSYYLYPATVGKPLSLSTQYVYDYSSGKVKQTTDPNGLVSQTIYDGFDRPVEEKQPDLTTPSTLVTKTTYAYTDTSGGVKVLKTEHLDASNTVEMHTYFDGFARSIQIRNEMEDAGNFAVTDTIYNNLEQVHKESLPYSSTGSSRTVATTDNLLLTTYSYDPVLRVTSIQNAVGTVSNFYDDWKTTVTDARGKVKHLYKDANGNLIKVEEVNSGAIYITLYEYDGTNNLKKITDALSNIRNFTYDGLGRRLTAQDLHASGDGTYGSWTYTYDDSGNLTQFVDPKSQTVNYTYDDINRVLTENYTGATGTEVTYTYDSCAYGKPRLCAVTPSTGSGLAASAYSYNSNGGVASEVKTIQSTNYTTSYTYDRQGNVVETTNPGDFKVKYTYNQAGLPETVQRKESGGSYVNVVTDFDYGPHGKITYQANQNGTATTNTYDATKLYRLSNKVTAISSTELQNLAYTYDANGNITKIIDTSDINAAKTVDYTYDDLNRLLTATSTNAANGQNYTKTYSYSAIGNISTGDAGTYSYDGSSGSNYANPHAVTAIGSDSLTYDNNGNVLTSTTGGGSSSIALDATTTSISSGYSGTTTKTWSHTTSSGTNRLLVLSADIWQDVAGTGTITSASYNGVAMTKATNTRIGGMATEVWYLTNPAAGANTVSVTVTGATDAIKLASSTFTGIDQTTPLVATNTATGSSGNPSVSRTTTVANSLLAATLSRFSTTASTTNRTSLYNDTTGSILGAASYQLTTTIGSYSDTYTGSSSNDWSMIVAEFRPASTSGTTKTNTWNYKNQLTQTVVGSTTVVYDYDHTGQRVRLYNGTTNTHYPSKYYNAAGTTETRHIFTPTGELVATIDNASGGTSTITPDATTTSISSGYSGTTTKTWSHTTSSGSNRLLVLSADIWQDVAGTGAITAASYNGVAMTKVTNTRSGGMASEIWYLVNPATGVNTVSVTITGATDAIKLAASTFTGAAQTSVLDASNTATGTSGNPTVSFTTATANDLVLATLSRFSTTAATTNRTSLYNNTTGSILGASSYQLSTTAGSYSDTYTGSSNNDWSMVIAAFKPATTSGGIAIHYTHTDHLTGSNVVSNSSGTQEELMDYYPYGSIRLDEKAGSFSEQRKFTGYEYDSDTGLNYAGARYYNSAIGRFISQDPAFINLTHLQIQLVDPQSWNSYSYVKNNPLKYVDPDGQFWEEAKQGWVGFSNAVVSNNLFGYGRQDGNNSYFNTGQTIGDVFSLVQGSFEIAAGIVGATGSAAGGLVFALPTGGLSVGAGSIGVVEGVVVAGHGSSVVQASMNNLKTKNGFSQAGKRQIQTENKTKNNGSEKCTNCGTDLEPGKRLQKGDKIPENRREHDHIMPRAQGGPSDPKNGQLLCNTCHTEKTRFDNKVTRWVKSLFSN